MTEQILPTARYPDCVVEIIGTDGNAFSILGKVIKGLRRYLRAETTCTPEQIAGEIHKFQTEATSGDYNHLLLTVQMWVEIS